MDEYIKRINMVCNDLTALNNLIEEMSADATISNEEYAALYSYALIKVQKRGEQNVRNLC